MEIHVDRGSKKMKRNVGVRVKAEFRSGFSWSSLVSAWKRNDIVEKEQGDVGRALGC